MVGPSAEKKLMGKAKQSPISLVFPFPGSIVLQVRGILPTTKGEPIEMMQVLTTYCAVDVHGDVSTPYTHCSHYSQGAIEGMGIATRLKRSDVAHPNEHKRPAGDKAIERNTDTEEVTNMATASHDWPVRGAMA